MTCSIYEKNDLICLSFSDRAAAFPSKSNDADIGYRNGKPFVRHTKSFHKRIAYIKTQYRLACQVAHINIHYDEQKLFAFCLLGSKTRIHDSHNFPKTFCDFAEDMGIISNDRLMTCWAIHKKDCDIIGKDITTTDIFLCLQPQIIMQNFFQELIK